MSVPNRQIGWSQESNLLWYILSQLKRLSSVIFTLKEAATPKYKVYTALLTQSGGSFLDKLESSSLIQNVTKGVTYTIDNASDGDFTNVGAPNNDVGTSFVAINDNIPNNYNNAALLFNTGAPVVTVLENTIGNIWFEYNDVGYYTINSDGLFTTNKTYTTIQSQPIAGNISDGIKFAQINYEYPNINNIGITTGRPEFDSFDDYLINTPIEIRVYN
jgi:hypothetical protein